MVAHNNAVNNLFFTQKVTTVSIDYTVLPDDVIICVSDTSAQRQITLPAPSLENQGKCFVIKDSSGGAGTYPITVKSTVGLIDGAATIAIASNYGSLEVYSDGTQYFSDTIASFSPTGTLARGGWKKFAKNSFFLKNTQIADNINILNQPMPASAQVDFSELNPLTKPEKLIQAGGKITFTQPGLYQIIFQAIVGIAGHPIFDLVKNGSTLLFYFMTISSISYNCSKLTISQIQTFAANDFIDFRIGKTWSSGSYSFYSIACFVQQLSTEQPQFFTK